MSFFIADVMANNTGFGGQGDMLSLLLPIGLVVVLYVFMIQPQVKRQKLQQAMINALERGDEIVTSGGVAGKITNLGDNFASIEVAQGVQIKIRISAIETVLPKGSLKEL